MSQIEAHIPLFPLQTVLFPQGPLPLRIFEQRYIDMVSECLRNDHGFGVCLIREGNEVGEASDVFAVGTLAEITDWNQSSDGLLLITAVGRRRFQMLSRGVRQDRLTMADVRFLAEEHSTPLPQAYYPLADLLRVMVERVGPPYSEVPANYEDAAWVAGRLLELLPLPNRDKQKYLEAADPLSALKGIVQLLQKHGMI